MTLIEKFWANVVKGAPDACWEWIGQRSRGKPTLFYQNTTMSARRAGWLAVHGYLPKHTDHIEVTCSNVQCVNVGHMICPTPLERFWSHVDKNGPTIRPELGPCWIWTGARFRHGYGMWSIGEAPVKATKISWELAYGPMPVSDVEICLLHKCDNPPCMRPEHLWLGTDADNIADCIAKGRNSRGPEHGEKVRLAKEARANMKRLAEAAMSSQRHGEGSDG